MKKLKRALGAFGGQKAAPKERKEKSERRKSSSEVVPVPSTSQSTPKQTRGESVLERLESKAYDSSDSESNSRCSPVRAYVNPLNTEDPLFTKLHRAAYHGDLEKIKKALLKTEINCEDADRRTPLHLCASGGHSEAISFLIASGANLEAEDKGGRTPFLRAVEKGHIQAVQTFLQHQVNAFARDLYNNTGLHVAAQAKSQPLVELLIEVGLDYDLPDVKGQTPLHIAAANLDMEVVSSLLCNGANQNAKDKEGVTALMLAAKQGFQPLVELLLEFKANPDLMDCSGWSAASYAKYCGYLEVHNFLQKIMTMDLASKVKMNKRLSVSLGAGLKGDFSQDLETVSCADNDVDENSWKDSSSCSSVEPLEKMDLKKFMAMSNDSLLSKDERNNTSKAESSLDNSIASTSAGPPKPPRSFGSTPDLSKNLETPPRSPTLKSNMSSPNLVSLHNKDYKEGEEVERKAFETKEEIELKRKSVESNSILASLSSSEVSFGDETNALSLGDRSPLKFKKDLSLEENSIKPTNSPNASFGGTLGRKDTLQEVEEIWESNGSLSHRKEKSEDSEVSSASSTKSKHVQENDRERIDDLHIRRRFFGDSKENVSLEDTFDFRRPSFADISRKRTLSRSSLFEKISVRRDSLFEVLEDSPLRKSSSFIEPDKDPLDPIDDQNSEKELANILKSKEIPVDLEELHFIIRNLRIHLNREHTKKKNYLTKIKWSEKIKESLENELKSRDEIIWEHKAMVQELQEQKTEITYDLKKQKEETQYFSALLREAKMELKILQGEKDNLNADTIRKNYCIQNLQEELERKDIVLSALQSKFESMSPISDKKEALTQTTCPQNVCSGSQTDITEPHPNEKVGENKIASTVDKEVQWEEMSKKEEKIESKSLSHDTKWIQKSTQTPCISVASSLIQTDDLEDEIEDLGVFLASESTSKSANEIEDSARGSTRTTDFSLSSVAIQTENDSVLSKLPQDILNASTQAKIDVLDSSSQTKTTNLEISSQTEINVCDESSQTKTDVKDNYSQANPNLNDNESQTKIQLSDEISIRNVDNQENSSMKKVLLDKTFQTESKQFSNNSNTIECCTQTNTKVFSNNSSQVTIDVSDFGIQAESNTTNLDISSQTPLIKMMSVSCQNSLENITENSSQTSNDFNVINKVGTNEASEPPTLINSKVDKCSPSNMSKDKFSQTMKQTNNTTEFDDLQKFIVHSFDQLNKDITEKIIKSNVEASDTTTNAIFEMKSTSETIREDIEEKIHQNIDNLHKDLSTKFLSWFERQNERESSEVSRTLSIEKEIIQLKEGLTKQLDNIFAVHKETSLKSDQTIDLLNQNAKLASNSLEQTNSLPNKISEVVNKSLEEIISILSKLDERSVKHEENVTPSLERLKSNFGEISKSMVNNEESFEKLKEDLEISIKHQKGQEALIRKVKIFDEHWAQDTLEEIIASIERVIKENDHQIHTNLKKTLNNIDETVGANFEVVETLIHSLKNDLTKKVNEISNEKVEGIENTEQKFEKLFKELKNLSDSLLSLRSITESQNDDTHSKSIFDSDIIEAIRGGNDQALTAIQAQNSSVLKILENCECSLKKLSESEFSSMARIALESEHETERRELLKEIELLKSMISSTESVIDVERKRFHDERDRRIKLDDENDSLRKVNERHNEENSNLKVNFLNLKNEFENMIARNLHLNRSDSSLVTETGHNRLGQVNLIETVSKPREIRVETDYKQLIHDLEKELNYLRETNTLHMEEKARILNETKELKRLSREQVQEKEMEVKALERDLSKSDDQKQIAERERKDLLKENQVLRDEIRKAGENLKSKSKILKNTENQITNLNADLDSLQMELTIVSKEKDDLKKEMLQLQRKLKLMRQHSKERNNLEKEVQHISTRNEELLNELSHKQTLVLNLRERVSNLSQEKFELMEEIGKCKEANLSSEIYLKQKEQAEMLVRKLVEEMNSLRENLDENFVPKAKLNALYEELEANFKIMFSKRLTESNAPVMEKINQMERVNGMLKAREVELKADLIGLQDQVKILSAKISFANYNAHLWKSKYQELFEEHYKIPRNVLHLELPQLKEKNDVRRSSDPQKPTFNDNILREVEELLKQPQETSSFLRELDIPDHNTPSMMSFSLGSASSTHEPDNNSNGSSVDICLKKYLKAEKDFNDFVPKKRKNKWIDPTSPTTLGAQMIPSNSMSSSSSSSSTKTLQESFDEYAKFLRKS